MVTWAFAPLEGNLHMAAYVDDPAEFAFILKRGYVTLDGQRADLVDSDDPNLCDPVSGFMRFQFRAPFRRRVLIDVTPLGALEPVFVEGELVAA
jgi:hypothetical protein